MFIKSFNNIIDDILEKDYCNSRKVLQIHPYTLQIIKVWNSAAEVGKWLGLNHSNITLSCQNKYEYCGGYYWRYYDEFINSQYIRCDKNNYLDIFNLLPGGNLSNYIEPCFTLLPGEILGNIDKCNNYQISNYGRIISIKNYPYIKEIKPFLTNGGYYRIALYNDDGNNKKFFVHCLVADTFIPNPNNFPCINHKDENKLNNHVNNLERCNHEYNNNYGTRNKRLAKSLGKIIEQIDLNTGKVINEFWSMSEAERITGINHSHISAVCLEKRNSAGGFNWRFKELK